MMIKQLKLYIEQNKNVVIGIDGPSGSGKSTLAADLEKNYEITVFHVDDYFLPQSRKTIKRLSEPGGNFDYERMELEIFHHLNDIEITSNKYDCKTDKLELRNPVKRKNIILIEGVYSLHPRFKQYYNFTVFLDVNRNVQLERILKRSNKEMFNRFVHDFIPLEELYFNGTQLRTSVDLLIK
jgi:uridine kinase